MNKTLIKIIFLIMLAFLSGGFFWRFLYQLFYAQISWAQAGLGLGISFVFLIVFLSLDSLLIKERKWMLICFSSILILGLLFFHCFHIVALSLLLMWFGYEKICQEKKNYLRINIRAFLKGGLFFYLIAMFLLIANFYYFSPLLDKDHLQDNVKKWFLKKTKGIVEKVLISASLLPSDLNQTKTREQIINDVSLNIEQAINKLFNQTDYFKYLPIGLTASLFFALFGLLPLFSWLTSSLVWVIIKAMLKTGLLVKSQEKCIKESLSFAYT